MRFFLHIRREKFLWREFATRAMDKGMFFIAIAVKTSPNCSESLRFQNNNF